MKKFLSIIVILSIAAFCIFATEISGVGYGGTYENAKENATISLKNKIKNEIFKGNDEAYKEFDIDAFADKFTYSDPILTGSQKISERYRAIATLDDKEIIDYVHNFESEEKETIEGNIQSYDEFLKNYAENQEQRRKADEEREQREIRERNAQSRLFKLSWEFGIDILFPVSKSSDNERLTSAWGIHGGIGTIIYNNFFIMFSASPTFATIETTTTNTNAEGKVTTTKTSKTKYYVTYMDLTAAYRLKWNNMDMYLGVAGGFAADTGSAWYIMPKLRLGIDFNTFKPVFESAAITVGGKYEFSSKIWTIGLSITLFGLY